MSRDSQSTHIVSRISKVLIFSLLTSLLVLINSPIATAAPAITSLDITSGSTAGGNVVTITGTGFGTSPTVTFGGTAVATYISRADTSIKLITPARAAGLVDVVVTNVTAFTLTNGFNYNTNALPPPYQSGTANISTVATSFSTTAGLGIGLTGLTVHPLAKSTRANLYDVNMNLIGTNAAYTTSVYFYGVKPSTTYKITVQSVGDGAPYSTGPESPAYSYTTTAAVQLSTPATPTFSSVLQSTFTAATTTITGASNYKFSLWDNSDNLIKTLLSSSPSAAFTSLTPGTPYKVSVVAIGSGAFYTDSLESLKGSTTTLATVVAANPGTTVLSASTPSTLTFTLATISPGITIRSTLYASDQTTVISSIPVTSGSVTFTGLTPATDYFLRYLVIGDGIANTTGALSAAISGRTSNADAVLTPPTLTFNSRTPNSITVSSSSVPGATYLFHISDNTGTLINKYASGSASTTVTGLRPSTTYQIKVSAVGIGFPESAFSNVITQATDSALTLSQLPTPTVGAVTSSTTTISIPLTSVLSPGLTFVYKLFASDQTTLIKTTSTPDTSVTFFNLAPGTTYFYSVYLAGNSLNNLDSASTVLASKATASFSRINLAPTIGTPAYDSRTPTAVSVTASTASLGEALSFTLNIFASDGITQVGTIPNYVSGAAITGLQPNTSYRFSLEAIGDGVFYNTATSTMTGVFTTRAGITLPVVLPQIGALTPQSVALTFTSPTGAVSMTARLYSATNELLTLFPSYTSGAVLSSILLPNTSYKVTLQALGNGSTTLSSAESDYVSFTTPDAIALQVPTLIASTTNLSANSASLSYAAPTGTFTSCRLNVYDSSSTLLFQISSYTSTAIIRGLSPDTSYKASLKCFGNGSGYLDSPESQLTTFLTGASTQLLAPVIANVSPTLTNYVVNYTSQVGTLQVRLKIYDNSDTLLQTVISTSVSTFSLTGLIVNTQYKISATAIGNGTTILDSTEGPKFSFTANPTATMQVPVPSISGLTFNSATVTIALPLLGFSVLKVYNSDASVLLTSITSTLGQAPIAIPNLNPGTMYQVSVVALGTGAGYSTSAESEKISFTTPTSNQLATTAPTAVTATQTTLAFTFAPATGAVSSTGRLYSDTGTLLGIYPNYTTGGPIPGLLPSTTYKFTLTAIGNGITLRDGLESIPFAATTAAPITLAAIAPTTITVTPATVAITLPTVTGAVTQTVRVYNASNKLIATIPSYISLAVITSPFLPGNRYQITLQAIGNGITTFSSEESARVAVTTPDAITLTSPYLTNVTTTPNTMQLTFTSPVGSLSVLAKIYSADGNTLLAAYPAVVSTGTYGNLQPNTTYQVSLTAIGNGLSYLSSPESAKFPVRTAAPITLAVPTFTVSPLSGTSVGLTITALAGANVYTVKAYSADGTTLISTTNATTAVTPISGLTPNTSYQFSVTAIGNGSVYLNSAESTKLLSSTTALTTALPKVPNSAWIKSAGGIFGDAANAVVVDSSNNVYVAGYFNTQATFGSGADLVQLTSAGGNDIFVAKYSSTGTLLWVRQSGGTGTDVAYTLKLDPSGNILVGGAFSGVATFGTDSNRQSITSQGGEDGFIAKYGADGSFSWVRQLSGTSTTDRVQGMDTDASGNIFVVGFFGDNLVLGTGAARVTLRTFGSNDAFIAKYASNGALLWVKQIGGTGADALYGIAVDKGGNAIVSGTAAAGVIFGSGATAQTLLVQGGADSFIAKYNTSGDLLWMQSGGGSSTDFSNGVAVDSNNNIYTVGYFNGGATFGTGADAQAVSAALTIAGGVSQDAYLAKYSSAGRLLWIRTMGGATTDNFTNVAVDSVGNVYVGGSFNISANISGGGQSQNLSSQ